MFGIMAMSIEGTLTGTLTEDRLVGPGINETLPARWLGLGQCRPTRCGNRGSHAQSEEKARPTVEFGMSCAF
jgi:hypothetical protein